MAQGNCKPWALVKESFRHIGAESDLSIVKVNMPMDDQV